MEVPREPGLDAAVFTDNFNELAALQVVGVVQPAASINNVILLQHAKTGPVGGSMGEDHNLPSLRSGVVLDRLFEPSKLFIVNGNFVRSVCGVTENSRTKTDEEGLLSDQAAKLRRRLAVGLQVDFKVFLVCGELVQAFKIVVSADNLIRNAERSKIFSGEFMACSGSSKEFRWVFRVVVAVLGLAKISKRNKGNISILFLAFLEDWHPLLSASFVILHLSRINVQITQNTDHELIRSRLQTGKSAEGRLGRCREGMGQSRNEKDKAQLHFLFLR